MVRKFVRQGVVVALGLAALVFAAFSAAPTQVGAVDYFTAVGCQVGDYQCLYAHNGINPNAPQIDVSAIYGNALYGYNPYFYGIGSTPYYGYGYSNYPFYGYGYGNYPYYGYGYSNYPFYGYYPYYGYSTTRASSAADIARVTGFCNLGAGIACYPTK